MKAGVPTNAWARWYKTPLRDLVRGRLSGRLDLDVALAPFDLPETLAQYVKDAARRTGLCRLDRSNAAARLAARVRGLVDDGHDPAEIMHGLGEPRALGKALRREHLGAKSLLWNLRRQLRRASWASMALMVPVYIYLAIWFHTARPQIKRNFSRELSAPALAVPEVDRALPLYLEVMALTPSVPEALGKVWPRVWPGDPEWDHAAAYLGTCGPGVEVLRKAAAKPGLGAVLSDAPDPRWSHSADERAAPPVSGTENPPVLDLVLPQFGAFRWSARLLALDMRAGAVAGEPARVVADFRAILGVARHSAETRLMIAELVSFSILSIGCHALGEVIERYPGQLSDSQLAELASALHGYGAGEQSLLHADDLSCTVEDFLQRAYTDDGSGNGRMCAAGLRYLSTLGAGGPGRLSVAGAIFGPVNVQFMASRRELHEKCRELVSLAKQDLQLPTWKRTEFLTRTEIDRLEADPELAARFRIVCILVPAFSKAIESANQLAQERGATQVLIALERHRLAHHEYPSSLGQLVPQFLSELPPDQYDGKPLKYRLLGGKPLVYSCGSDADDDGGRMPAGWRGNDKARRWFPPARRSEASDGDLVLWPDPPEPKRDE